MQLYRGSAGSFIETTKQNQIALKLKEAYFNHFGFSPSVNEEMSWRNLLRAIKDVFADCGFNEQGVTMDLTLVKQLKIYFDNNELVESNKENSSLIQIHCDKNYSSLSSMKHVMDEISKILNDKFGLDVAFDCNIERDYSKILEFLLSSKKKNFIENDNELMKYWIVIQNGNVKPFMLSKGSNKLVWWECPDCKKIWQQKVFEMSNKKRKCINCYNVNRTKK